MVTVRKKTKVPARRGAALLAGLLVALVGAWGCGGPSAAKKEEKPEPGPIFYPLPPDKPRIQYLTSFRSNADIEEKKQTSFQSFILGKEAEAEEIKNIRKPYGVAVHDGVIYVADIRQQVVLTLDLKQREFDALQTSGRGLIRKPANIFIEPDGTRYVTDVGREQVVVFGPDGRYKMALGDGKEMKPSDAVASDGRVYVCDMENHMIRVFDKASGELLFSFGSFGKENGEFNKPNHLALDAEGNLYVSDLINCRIQKFDRDGEFLSTFGVCSDSLGAFARPKGVAVDREGNIYVVDAAFENIQVFNQEGRLLMFFGGPGNAPGHMYLPVKVAIDYDNVAYFQKYMDKDFEVKYLLLVTNQFGDFPVSVYGFGALKK